MLFVGIATRCRLNWPCKWLAGPEQALRTPRSQSVRPTLARAWLGVAALTFAYIIAFVDWQVISLLVEPIKADFGLSDTEMSLLQGLSFALFYTLLGLPIGRLADQVNRRNLAIAGIAVWSLMTAACGMARNFPQLFLARMGVGVGPLLLGRYPDRTDQDRQRRALALFGRICRAGPAASCMRLRGRYRGRP